MTTTDQPLALIGDDLGVVPNEPTDPPKLYEYIVEFEQTIKRRQTVCVYAASDAEAIQKAWPRLSDKWCPTGPDTIQVAGRRRASGYG